MQVTISDSDLIREKLDHLFHDKTTKILNNYAKTNLIIINPSALIDIFYLARISSKENLDLLDLLKTINKIISKDAINSLSVYSEGVLHYSGNSKRSLARYIIEFYYELREKKMDLELLEEVKKILIFLVRNNYLERSVIRVIYQQVIKEYYQGFVFKETIENSINMLYDLLTVSEVNPQSFFYFNYHECGLGYISNNKRSMKWPFNNNLTLALWFYIENLETYESNFPSLFIIHCFQKGGGGIETYFKGKKLFYRLLTINHEKASNTTNGIEIGEFLPRKWYFIGLEHEKYQTFGFSSGSLTVYINNESPKKFTLDYLKMEQGKTITTLLFGKYFVGKMTSIMLFSTPLRKKLTELYSEFHLGIYNNPLLQNLKNFFAKNKIKPFLLYMPNRVIDNTIIVDLIDQNHGKFLQNTGFISKEQDRLKMSYYGGMAGILPYFYFLRYMPDQETVSDIYNKLLRILMVLFTITIDNQKEAGEINLFRIIGMLLSETPFQLISHNIMESLAEMRNVIQERRLLDQFFMDVIWNISLIVRIDDINLSNDYFKFIRILYVDKTIFFSNLMSIPTMLRISIYKFDAKNMECCLSHCLNIGLIKPNTSITKEFKWDSEKILSPIISIVELVLTHEAISEEIVCLSLKNIIEMLIIKSSSCFQLSLLKSLKMLLIDGACSHISSEELLKTITESKLVYIMLYIVANTLCPDIKAYCIKLINFLIKNNLIYYENYSTKEIAAYLSLVLWNLTPTSSKPIKAQIPESLNNNSTHLSNAEEEIKVNSNAFDLSTNLQTSKSKSIINFDLKSAVKPLIISNDLPGFGNNNEEEKTKDQRAETFSLKKPKSFNLKIDTEEINKNFDFGGEKGQSQNIEQEIKLLASECVNYMRKNSQKHIIQDENLSKTLIPQSLIKTDYFNEKSTDESQTIDYEEIQWDCEPLYNSIMEWLLGRHPSSLESDLLIDDLDQIQHPEILSLIYDFYKKSPGCLKAKIIQDFYMLVKWNKGNIQLYLEDKEFIAWLLDILLDQQTLLMMKESERSAFDAAIWDIGNKIIIILMGHTVENNYNDAHERIYYILQYIQLKSYYTNNKKNNDKEKNISHSAKFLLRQIWNALFENLRNYSESVHTCKPMLSNTLWKNMTFVIYFTLDIVCSVYTPKPLSPSFKQKCVDIYPTIKKCVNDLNEDEKIPSNFEGIMKEYQQIDSKLIENLFKLLDPVWLEGEINKPVSLLLTSEVERLESKIANLMDFKHSPEYSQKLEFLLFEPFLGDTNINRTKGPIIKLILLLLTLMIDFSLNTSNLEHLAFWLEKFQLIFKSLLLLGENARDKPFPITRLQEKSVISNLLYMLRYIYFVKENKKNPEFQDFFIKIIKDIGLFIIFIIDHMNERYGGFANIPKEFKLSMISANPLIPPYNFLLYEIFNNILYGVKGDKTKIISIPDIKSLKNEDLSDLHNVVLSDNWIYAFVDNQMLVDYISEHFTENLYLKLHNAHQTANENRDIRRKCLVSLEEINKKLKNKLENEVYELILWILETNEEKKNNDWYNMERKKRQAKNQWKKCWKKLRIYENIWQPDELKTQNDNFFWMDDYSFEALKPDKYFYYEISKYEVKNKSRPYLKMKLKEPKMINSVVDKYSQNETVLNYQQIFNLIHQNFYVKYQYNNRNINESPFKTEKFTQNITDNLLNLGGKAFNTLKMMVAHKQKNSPLLKPPNEYLFQRKCQWITTLTLKTGIFTITPNKIIFHHDCLIQKDTHLSILLYKLPAHTPFYKEWPLSSLKDILRHRFILKKTALDFVFKDGTSLLINFPDTDPTTVLQRILSFIKGDMYSSLNTRILTTIKIPQIIEKSKIFKKWMNYEITNFEYLMHLNALSGRCYCDITQYPVFPWVISIYGLNELPMQVLSPEKIFRNLSKSMGALGDEERIKTFRERYEHTDAFDPVPNYHFGSHYSSPAIILQYLIRLAPYNKGHKELQGGKFDLADRLFFSLQESFKGATEEISDVRELTPEFYYCPEFLLNLENHDFGIQQTGNRVHNVKLPLWSQKPLNNSNPYNFIKMHRELLEDEYVSENINNWIDLIFGYKQRGKEAINSLNTFFYLTYEDGIDLDKLEKENFRISYESQIIHFGQTPRQIFFKPHMSRPSFYDMIKEGRIVTDPEYQAKFYKYKGDVEKKKSNKIDNESNNENEAIICIKFVMENRIGVIKKNGIVNFYEWSDSPNWIKDKIAPFRITRERQEKINLLPREFDPKLSFFFNNNIKVGFLKRGKTIVVGGDYDGSLKVYSLDLMEELPGLNYYCHHDPITALEIDIKEKFLITGSKSGECIYWQINYDYKLSPKHTLYDHDGEILTVNISNDMKSFATGGIDQKIFIYNYDNAEIFKSFLHPDQQPIHNLVLSSSPLPIVVFYSNLSQMLYSYSINGQLLEKVKEEAIILNNFSIIKALNGLDVLSYTTIRGELVFRSLPYLELRKRQVIQGVSILTMAISKDSKFILFGCAEGEIDVLADPSIAQKSMVSVD